MKAMKTPRAAQLYTGGQRSLLATVGINGLLKVSILNQLLAKTLISTELLTRIAL